MLAYVHRFKSWTVRLRTPWGNFINFFYVFLRSKFFRCIDFLGTVLRFYRKNHDFARTDFALISEYWLDSPFAISKRYLQLKLEPDVYQYGETPLLTMEKIAQYAQINVNDCVFELGCGTGRCAFWLAYFRACSVVAIEQISDFTSFAQRLLAKSPFLSEKIHFIQGDFLCTDLQRATVIYLYGTKMDNRQIELLILNLKNIQPGTTIITVSYSLNEIIATSKNHTLSREYFEIIAQFEGEFFWGKATVFIQKKCSTINPS
ncbi:MAG: class I SAM-dependent methyltransferase [Puniceicoccales bacterium]|nr:class I SAM-dependent methyltransferase [Puniceicoccales bacterium]